MIRRQLMERGIAKRAEFHWRGEDVSRLESFSDAVFGFALTLLAVSQEVPHNYLELLATAEGFGAFFLCFAMLGSIWYNHYIFFRRYGLQDVYTTFLNLSLLAIVVFAVYPLKFLFTLVVGMYLHIVPPAYGHGPTPIITAAQFPGLMVIYGLGLAAIFVLFLLLYVHAYRLRAELNLSRLEVFDTKAKMLANSLSGGVALLSVALALWGGRDRANLASLIYLLIPGVMLIERQVLERRRRNLAALPMSEGAEEGV